MPFVNGVSYKWTYSGTGATITENTATINYGINATAGILSVVGSNPSGSSAARTMAISIGNCTILQCLGNAISLIGNEYVEIPSAIVRPTTALTYEFWVKSAATNGKYITMLNNGFYVNNSLGSGAYIQIYDNATYGFSILTENGTAFQTQAGAVFKAQIGGGCNN